MSLRESHAPLSWICADRFLIPIILLIPFSYHQFLFLELFNILQIQFLFINLVFYFSFFFHCEYLGRKFNKEREPSDGAFCNLGHDVDRTAAAAYGDRIGCWWFLVINIWLLSHDYIFHCYVICGRRISEWGRMN